MPVDELPPKVGKTRKFDDLLLRYCNAVDKQNTIEKWTKACILPFPKKDDQGFAKKYQGISLASIAGKIYDSHQTRYWENSLEESKWFLKKPIHNITDSDNPSKLRRSLCKKPWGNTINFSKAFDSINRGKMEPTLLAYGLLKENVAAIMMHYKNTKVRVYSLDRDTDFFNIVTSCL